LALAGIIGVFYKPTDEEIKDGGQKWAAIYVGIGFACWIMGMLQVCAALIFDKLCSGLVYSDLLYICAAGVGLRSDGTKPSVPCENDVFESSSSPGTKLDSFVNCQISCT
jgi:hypothetical protein